MKNFIIRLIVSTTVIAFLILCFHMEATYTMKGTVYSIKGNEVTFEDATGNLFSCYTEEEHPHLHKGDEFVLKFDHKGDEAHRENHTLIGFGKYRFLCFVW